MNLMWAVAHTVLIFICGMLTMSAIMQWKAQRRHNNHVRRWLALPPLHSIPTPKNLRTWAKPDGKPRDPDATGTMIPKSWMPQ